ncbi:hypothetical protein BS78_01G231100 [Paspalum vaginatum]|nr:hypothetical protein BS78_01G231100 [Paspalum vaginatum]
MAAEVAASSELVHGAGDELLLPRGGMEVKVNKINIPSSITLDSSTHAWSPARSISPVLARLFVPAARRPPHRLRSLPSVVRQLRLLHQPLHIWLRRRRCCGASAIADLMMSYLKHSIDEVLQYILFDGDEVHRRLNQSTSSSAQEATRPSIPAPWAPSNGASFIVAGEETCAGVFSGCAFPWGFL